MTDPRKTLARIYGNIVHLLDQGVFAGQYAPAINEARAFIAANLEEINVSLQQEEASAASASSGSGEDASGVAGGGVPDSGR
jgi:hypothetical protein